MFGNTLGWILSALIVALTAGGIYWIDASARATPVDAFGRDGSRSAELRLLNPAMVVPMVDGESDSASA